MEKTWQLCVNSPWVMPTNFKLNFGVLMETPTEVLVAYVPLDTRSIKTKTYCNIWKRRNNKAQSICDGAIFWNVKIYRWIGLLSMFSDQENTAV